MFTRHTLRLTMLILIMVVMGILMVGNSSYIWAEVKYQNPWYFMERQIIFACIGFICMLFTSKLSLDIIRKYDRWFYIVCIVTLVMVLIPKVGVMRNGSRSWFALGPILLQPSEFYKLAAIFLMSDLLAKKKYIQLYLKDLLKPCIYVGLGIVLIIIQPDFGSAFVLLCTIAVIVFVAGTSMKYFIRASILGMVAIALIVVKEPYRFQRILSFINPWNDPLGAGFQMIQSLFAIAPGGLFGVGINQSMQKHFYLPEPQTDFIFAIFAEEFGLFGCIILIVFYALIIYEGVQIAKYAKDGYSCYVAMGIISLFSIQVMINLGVVVGLLPVTGITLPLFSYGGSSLIMVMSSFGILASIANKN